MVRPKVLLAVKLEYERRNQHADGSAAGLNVLLIQRADVTGDVVESKPDLLPRFAQGGGK